MLIARLIRVVLLKNRYNLQNAQRKTHANGETKNLKNVLTINNQKHFYLNSKLQ